MGPVLLLKCSSKCTKVSKVIFTYIVNKLLLIFRQGYACFFFLLINLLVLCSMLIFIYI